MPKVLAIVIGVAAGALGGALVFLLLAFSLYDGRRSPWEWTILGLILYGTMAAALVGGAVGVVAGIRVAGGEKRRAAVTYARGMGTVAVLTLLGAAGLWAAMRMPRSDPAEQQKKQWARAMGPLDSTVGLELAYQLLGCHAWSRSLTADALISRGCAYAHPFLIGSSIARFDRGDKGWRWEIVSTAGGDKAVVRPDPLLKQSGPIFEFDNERLLVRREAPDAPAFAIDTPIPAVEAYRECLLASGTDGCAHLEKERVRVQEGTSGAAESHRIRLLSPETAHLLIRLFPRGRHREGPFELHITGRGRVYMFQEGGGWHVTNNRNTGAVSAQDPPPEPCEMDPRLPCTTEAQ